MNGNEESAKAILSQVLYITLATVGPDGLPWNTPVYAAFDEEYQFFWVSASQVRHSQNIKATHRVAIVVYDSPARAGTGKGVYIEARADEVTEEQEIIHALQALERRGWKKPLQEVMGASIHRVYKAVPEHISISTVGSHNGQLFDTRATVDLKEKKMNKVISKDGTPIAFDRVTDPPSSWCPPQLLLDQPRKDFQLTLRRTSPSSPTTGVVEVTAVIHRLCSRTRGRRHRRPHHRGGRIRVRFRSFLQRGSCPRSSAPARRQDRETSDIRATIHYRRQSPPGAAGLRPASQ